MNIMGYSMAVGPTHPQGTAKAKVPKLGTKKQINRLFRLDHALWKKWVGDEVLAGVETEKKAASRKRLQL